MSERADFDWMRLVLRSLYDDLSQARAIDAIRSADVLHELRDELKRATNVRDGIDGIPDGDFGDNLLLALLALRTKFPFDEAAAKLETNIAMRTQRAGARSR